MWALAAYTPRAFLWMKDADALRLSSLGFPLPSKSKIRSETAIQKFHLSCFRTSFGQHRACIRHASSCFLGQPSGSLRAALGLHSGAPLEHAAFGQHSGSGGLTDGVPSGHALGHMTRVFDSIRLASGAPWASDAGIRAASGIIRISYPTKIFLTTRKCIQAGGCRLEHGKLFQLW